MSQIRRIAAAIGVCAALAGGLVGVAAPAAAAGSCVQIYRIVYNSAGTDNRSNTSLNGEWIQLRNGCSVASTLTSARFKDAAGHVYTFAAYTLGARKYVKVHTGRGTNTASDRYWGLRGYVWNNDKDTAYLYNRLGTRTDTCSYNNARTNSRYC